MGNDYGCTSERIYFLKLEMKELKEALEYNNLLKELELGLIDKAQFEKSEIYTRRRQNDKNKKRH